MTNYSKNDILSIFTIETSKIWQSSDSNSRNILPCSAFPLDTGRKLNVHKTFKRRPGRSFIYVQFTSRVCGFNNIFSHRIWISTFECKSKCFSSSIGNIKHCLNWVRYFASKILVASTEYKWKLCQNILPGVCLM